MTTPTLDAVRDRACARRTSLLSATILASFVLQPAQAARFGVVVNPVADPLLAGLAIPDNAPTAGMWSGVRDWPMNAIHLGLLPSGKVVSFGTAGGNPGVQDGRTFDIWDPYRGLARESHLTLRGPGGVNSFCATDAFQADGSLLISGGIFEAGNDKGSAILNITANTVTAAGARLANDRYYSTMLTLPNGQQIIMGGSYPYLGGYADPQGSIDRGWMTGMTPEVYDGGAWRSLFGATSREAFGPDFGRFWYPRAWVAPNGRIFGISSERMWTLDPAGNGAVTTMPFREAQRNAGTAADAPNVGPSSTAVMYEPGKILQVGGNSYDNGNGFLASSRASLIDINGAAPVATDAAPMSTGRAWANATILPNGIVAVTGGSKWNDRGGGDVVLASEFWDPKTGRWSVGASGAVYRGYHSTAILMQNGALLIAGGGAPGPVDNQNAEFFYPPYLFTTVGGRAALAPRPQIISLSTNRLQHGQAMQFELASPNGVAQVVLIGLSQVTHSFNTTQRRYPASFTQTNGTVTLQTPPNTAIAPPGYYQLVAIDEKGVPSPGVIVALGAVAAPPQSAAPIVGTPATAGGTGTAGGGTTAGGGGTGTGTGTGGTGTNPGTDTGGGTGGLGTGGGGPLKAANSGLCLAIPAGDVSDGALVTQQPCSGKAEQNWKIQAVNGGSALVNAATGKCLDASLATPLANGSRVYQWGCHGGTNQAWTPRAQGGGNAYVSVAANLCLDVFGATTQAGAGTVVWACNGGGNQTFTSPVTATGGATGPVAGAASAFTQPGTGNWTEIGVGASKIATAADGTTVTINRDNGTVWQYVADNVWKQLPLAMKDVAVVKANSIYGIGIDEKVYRYDGTKWTLLEGANNVTIAAAADGTVVVVNRNNEVWVKPTDDTQVNWRRLPGTARKVVPMNGRSFWSIGLDNNVYRSDGVAGWVYVGNAVSDIAASADGSVSVVNRNNGIVWRKIGDNTVEAWAPIPNSKAVSVAIPNSQRALAIGPDAKVYRY
ncbi:RICIN domain-containing protein [Methylobacterium sp. Leaf100]|uniref:RICIN domain-containing protein n=1 Tax=Methylobacterium sp. Leaf100 TaxID=1736252 RepID=UPI0006FC654D|nr:RICIN domain-containing protein [Methylobacterium sp. Leaf100]KQP36590.1 hypothetical protein ASF25_01090 [Methylobacterium sp. Leaf100]